MVRSFPDAGVLIDAARSPVPERAQRALAYLDDPHRRYLTSPLVRLECVPKARYTARGHELAFYEGFFSHPETEWCRDWERLAAVAASEAERLGLGALDALHLAAAHLLGADELVTTEAPTKPIHRSQLVRVVWLYDGLH